MACLSLDHRPHALVYSAAPQYDVRSMGRVHQAVAPPPAVVAWTVTPWGASSPWGRRGVLSSAGGLSCHVQEGSHVLSCAGFHVQVHGMYRTDTRMGSDVGYMTYMWDI